MEGKSIDLSYLRVFGSPVYVHDPGNDKLSPRAFKGIFLGYMDDVKGHRIWNLETKKVVNSRHVTFDESALFKVNKNSLDVPNLVHGESKEKEVIPTFRPRESRVVGGSCEVKAVDVTSHSPQDSSSSVGDVHEPREDSVQGGAEGRPGDGIATRVGRRAIRPPERYSDWNYLSFCENLDYALHVVQDEPMDLDDIMDSSDSSK